MKSVLGLDVGGTTIKGGVLDPTTGEILARGMRPYDQDVPAAEIHARAAALIVELEETARTDAHRVVGVGCAGLFDRQTGEVLASANMQNLVGTSLSGGISAASVGRHVTIENDANTAAFGEQWFGAGRDEPDLVLVTLGTGVGGGIVIGDQLFLGPTGAAGEIGHIAIHPRPGKSEYDAPFASDLRCSCGSYGCLERLVSATAVSRRARDRGLTDELPELAARARRDGGPEAAFLHQVGRDLGAGLATLVTLFDVDFFAIGGGFGAAVDLLEEGALEVLEERRYGTRPARIAPATLGADAGWIGAARLTLER
ncbi:MAG: ROK family protein [Planctomycetota bacterium]|nr:ROK family protein [Planctomycetota bacterium]